MDTVSQEKSKIENAQREIRAKEKEESRVWERRYFSELKGQDPVLEVLGPKVDLPINGDADKTGGLWRFDAEKTEKIRAQSTLGEDESSKVAKQLLGQ